jgi:hypothetical protein
MSVARDLIAAIGGVAFLYGAWLVHPALSWIAGGGTAMGFAVWWSWRARK